LPERATAGHAAGSNQGFNDATMTAKENDTFWLDHQERRNYSGFGRFPSRRERARDEMIRDWYGENLGRGVIQDHRRPAQAIGEGIPQLMKELGRSVSLVLDTLQRRWPEIVGADMARRTWPIFLRDGILTVEVLQAPWLYMLKTSGKNDLLQKLSQVDEITVTDVKFVPGGRTKQN
jgi:hypothetical protein